MRKVFPVLASAVALVFLACDRDANNNQGPAPSSYGGGPQHDDLAPSSAEPAPAGSTPVELPGMSYDGMNATDANGGSGAGATGSKGEGTTLHNGLNDKGEKKRPPMQQKKIDMIPNTMDATKKY